MELKEFIAETLQSIIEGVKTAQSTAEEHGALVNPSGLMRNTTNVSDNALWDNSNNVYAQSISFDVAVTVEEKSGIKGSIKILGGILNAEGGGQGGLKSSAANRVQFVVPIMLPDQKTKNSNARTKSSIGFSD